MKTTRLTTTLFLTAAACSTIMAAPGLAGAAPAASLAVSAAPVTFASEQPINPGPQGDCQNPNTGTNPGGNGGDANAGSTAGTDPGAAALDPSQCIAGTGGSTSGNTRTDQNGRSGLS